MHKARNVFLDFIILPSHMSHVLHLLDVVCFKPFKIAFRAYRDVWTLAIKVKRVRLSKRDPTYVKVSRLLGFGL
jgi:hypothetical protein